MNKMFRIGGNINFESTEVVAGQPFRVIVPNRKNLLAFIQCLKPLTVRHPYFSVTIVNSKPDSCVTIGIASLDINENTSPGSWTNTIGYESHTGKCLSSHRMNANTVGRTVQKSESFGLMVSYFGSSQSTVVFFHNEQPIATRYHFESDVSKYLPTITFENGPIEVEVMWPHAMEPSQIPQLVNKLNKIKWIKPSNETCEQSGDDEFENVAKLEEMPLQSSIALCKSFPRYKCTQLDVSPDGQAASVGIASCSPLKPTPTSSLLRDYYTWLPKMKLKPGNTIGWGVFYNPEQISTLNDKYEQLILVFVTYNEIIIDVLFVLQPEGGFYPLVLMQPWAKRVKLEMLTSVSAQDSAKLAKYFTNKMGPALDIYIRDLKESTVNINDIRTLNNIVNITIEKSKTVIKVPKNHYGVHYIQYKNPLTPERRFFFVELIKIDPSTNVVIGVAPSSILDEHSHKLPGQVKDTIGYYSKNGLMLYNNKSHGNMMGQKCTRGDNMGIEMELFDEQMSVALFSRNYKPVGTRFLTLKDFDKFLPTIAIFSSGEEIELNVYWHTVVSVPPRFNVRNPEDWCCPDGTKIDTLNKTFLLPSHLDHSLCLQAPYSLHQKYNHFEIVLVDDFDKNNPPPAIALCTACPFDPPPLSQFKQDYLRFWPTGEAMSAVKKNDRLGWGIFYADDDVSEEHDQLMICFLTINRQVVYLRVLFQPPGGFYPVVIAPPNVFRVKMDFTATRVSTEDFGGDQIKSILTDANKQIELEKRMIAQGKNPREQIDDSKRSKMCTII